MRFDIRTKLFLLLAGLTVVVLAGVLFSISRLLEGAILDKVFHDFNQTQEIFRKEQKLLYDRLVESAVLIGENTTFKANVQLQDPATTTYIVEEEFALITDLELFIVTDRHGKALTLYGAPPDFSVQDWPSAQRALRGEYDEYLTGGRTDVGPELLAVAGRLYQVAVVPVYLGDSVIGTITQGVEIDQDQAQQLKHGSAIDITFVLDGRLIASTIGRLDNASLETFGQAHRDSIAVALQGMRPSRPFSGTLAGQQVFAFVSPLGRGEQAYYVASVPEEYELDILFDLQKHIALAGGLSLLVTVFLALVLGRTLSRPILRLVEGMNRVKGGDLEVSLKATTRDEIGLLTSTFNEMIVGLRERMQLLRYVGSHTRDMIRRTSGRDVDLGGACEELAVMFTDIRGFTAFSEKRPPEEVISMLNRYLGFQARLVPEHDGSIDKFVGDEMVALFIGDRALERAISCALDIQQCVRLEHQSDPMPIHVGIGINYGPVILGNMGAQNRLDYTVIGAEVNLGARLCQAAGAGEILIRRQLLDGLQTPVRVVEIRKMSFKGFSQEMEIASLTSD